MTKRSLHIRSKMAGDNRVAGGGVMVIRYFCMESYRVSTDSMEVAPHKGDYMLVNKLPQKDNPGRNRVVLFTSPLLKDTTSSPLFLSRCIGMPGDTIRISNDGYRVNGRLIPHSPVTQYLYRDTGGTGGSTGSTEETEYPAQGDERRIVRHLLQPDFL